MDSVNNTFQAFHSKPVFRPLKREREREREERDTEREIIVLLPYDKIIYILTLSLFKWCHISCAHFIRFISKATEGTFFFLLSYLFKYFSF
jgi:hypothetical protein